jgi:hypothetical protein
VLFSGSGSSLEHLQELAKDKTKVEHGGDGGLESKPLGYYFSQDIPNSVKKRQQGMDADRASHSVLPEGDMAVGDKFTAALAEAQAAKASGTAGAGTGEAATAGAKANPLGFYFSGAKQKSGLAALRARLKGRVRGGDGNSSTKPLGFYFSRDIPQDVKRKGTQSDADSVVSEVAHVGATTVFSSGRRIRLRGRMLR